MNFLGDITCCLQVAEIQLGAVINKSINSQTVFFLKNFVFYWQMFPEGLASNKRT